jgi:molybdenum cofactor biosynthesis enzyme MoaA
MGRDTTANKRMAAKRSREKAAGLRRLNVALTPQVFEKLAELMKQLDCSSQARLIELLVMDRSAAPPQRKEIAKRNEVTTKKAKTKPKTASKKPQKTQKKPSTAKKSKGKSKVVAVKKEVSSSQMSLFDS